MHWRFDPNAECIRDGKSSSYEALQFLQSPVLHTSHEPIFPPMSHLMMSLWTTFVHLFIRRGILPMESLTLTPA